MAEMVGHSDMKDSIDRGFGQLLNKVFLVDKVFKLLEADQVGVNQEDWKRLHAAMSSPCESIIGT